MDEIVKVIQTVGFPAFFAVFFLLRLEKRLERINTQLNQLVGILAGLGDRSAVIRTLTGVNGVPTLKDEEED